MNAVTRWKTIATVAVAFSAGNLFSTACQDAGGGKANAEDGTTEDGTTGDDVPPPPEVSEAEFAELTATVEALEARSDIHDCVFRYLRDADDDGNPGEGASGYVSEMNVIDALDSCAF